MRLFLVVVEDARSEFESPDELAADLANVWRDYGLRGRVMMVRRGGLLARRVLEDMPPLRRGDRDLTQAEVMLKAELVTE